MRLVRLFEALEDRDEFSPKCDFCEAVETDSLKAGTELDILDFHQAHRQASRIADVAVPDFRFKWRNVWLRELQNRGYYRGWASPWHWYYQPTVKEGLDDQDEFQNQPHCFWQACYARADADEFHAAHQAASNAARSSFWLGRSSFGYEDLFRAEMNRRGYHYRRVRGQSGKHWIKLPKKV